MESIENTRAEGHSAQGMPKTMPKRQEKPINTRAEGAQERQERETMEKLKLFVEYMRGTCEKGHCTDRELADMHDAAEAIMWNIENIQKARKEGKKQ